MTERIITYRVGRDAITGRFITIAEAERRPETTVVVTIRRRLPSYVAPVEGDE